MNGHVLMTITKNCPNLTNLFITLCIITNKELNVLEKLPKLFCLRVKKCHNVTKEYFEEMFGNVGFFY